ncbi:MAG: tRNA-guanine transglycosylase, partial [Firmicutes bacterium]|nr:tRNA-guanine transglycosylase [Bacillota bacterium]
SRAYLRHLFKAGEVLALYLLTYHNLFFLYRLMETIKRAMVEDRFPEAREEFFSRFGPEKEEDEKEVK